MIFANSLDPDEMQLFAIKNILQKEKAKYNNFENFEQTTRLFNADEKFSVLRFNIILI